MKYLLHVLEVKTRHEINKSPKHGLLGTYLPFLVLHVVVVQKLCHAATKGAKRATPRIVPPFYFCFHIVGASGP